MTARRFPLSLRRLQPLNAGANDADCGFDPATCSPPVGANEFAAGKSQSPPARRLRGLGGPAVCGVSRTCASASRRFPRPDSQGATVGRVLGMMPRRFSAVEAPRSLRGFPLFQPRLQPPGVGAGSALRSRPPGSDGRFLDSRAGFLVRQGLGVRSLGMTVRAIPQVKPRAVCGAFRCSSRGFTRPGWRSDLRAGAGHQVQTVDSSTRAPAFLVRQGAGWALARNDSPCHPAGEAPRSLRGFPLSLRRLQPLRRRHAENERAPTRTDPDQGSTIHRGRPAVSRRPG
jgi:hypothetical protein